MHQVVDTVIIFIFFKHWLCLLMKVFRMCYFLTINFTGKVIAEGSTAGWNVKLDCGAEPTTCCVGWC